MASYLLICNPQRYWSLEREPNDCRELAQFVIKNGYKYITSWKNNKSTKCRPADSSTIYIKIDNRIVMSGRSLGMLEDDRIRIQLDSYSERGSDPLKDLFPDDTDNKWWNGNNTDLTSVIEVPPDREENLRERWHEFVDNTANNDLNEEERHNLYHQFQESMTSSRSCSDNCVNVKNLILYGPPGTGKTYSTVKKALEIIDNCSDYNIPRFNELLWSETIDEQTDSSGSECIHSENGQAGVTSETHDTSVEQPDSTSPRIKQIAFTTFHQSYGYEEFIEGYRPRVKDGQLTYALENGIFKAFCNHARNNLDQKFVFIIDEINRGNISKIFGELITLVEEDKRAGMSDERSCILPYSKERFTVPNNVYILGTMNTADRSLTRLDTALRRRFEFEEMMPRPDLLNDVTIGGINIGSLLDTMNQRIEALYDREHQIGHADFMKLNHNSTINDLARIMEKKIIPRLQEYFFDDWEKIRLVLGDNQKQDNVPQFITCTLNNNIRAALFGSSTDVEINEIHNVYSVNQSAFAVPNAYQFLDLTQQDPPQNTRQTSDNGGEQGDSAATEAVTNGTGAVAEVNGASLHPDNH